MNHQERIELLNALVLSGVKHFKSGDTEITFGDRPGASVAFVGNPPAPAPVVENPESTEKLKGLIESLKMNNEDLLDKIFPNGAGA